MKQNSIPGVPLPLPAMLKIAKPMRGIGSSLIRVFPKLREELMLSDMNISPEDYGAIMAFTCTLYFFVVFFVGFVFARILLPESAFVFALIGGAVIAALMGIQLLFYPKILLKKKTRDLERNLVFGLRTILVEIKSGVTLFDAINIISEGDNGQMSMEFKKAIQRMQTGTFQNDALEELAEANPSLHFRRAIWQLVNGLKAGSDTSTIMSALVNSLTKEKDNQIRKYGNSLKLLSLLYMMLGAIFPALGLTFLIILSTFPQIKISEWMFWGMLGFITLGQFMYLGMMKSQRPTLLGE